MLISKGRVHTTAHTRQESAFRQDFQRRSRVRLDEIAFDA